MLTKAFKQTLLDSVDNDTYKVALFNESATLNEDTAVYSPTNEITATGYIAGGCTLTGGVASLNGSVVELNFNPFMYENCNIVCRKALVYNASKSNMAVAIIDYGSDVGVVGSGTFVVDVAVRLI